MRIDHYRPGEVLRVTDRPAAGTGTSSFGRIARRRPAPAADAPPLPLQLHAAARAHSARVAGDLVATALRAVAARVRDLATHRTEVRTVAPGSARDADDDRLRVARAELHLRLY